jgi:energy-coupling factor transport system ATP-binding protein
MRIEVVGLTYIYDQGMPFEYKALNDVSLTIESESVTGIIGSTGSGKSTLIQHFNALLKPTVGNVLVDGEDISDKKVSKKLLRQRVGMVFQYPESQLFGETVEKDIGFGPSKMGLSADETRDRVEESMSMVGLGYEDYKDRSPFGLSGGEKRKVAIAGILALKPEVLVLDEPTAGLDPSSRKRLLEMIHSFREQGKTLVMVSHDMDEISSISDNVIVMNASKVEFAGTTDEAFSRPAMLRKTGLDVPMMSVIAELLRKRNFNIPHNTWTPKGLAQRIHQEIIG